MSFETANVKIVEREVNECSIIMSDIGSKILSTNDIPSITDSGIEFPLENACHFTIFLSFGDPRKISNLLHGRVGDTNDCALVLWRHVR